MPVLRSVRSAIARAVRRAIDIITDSVYSVAGEEPQAIADYAKEFYRGINVAKFSDTLSHSRASNATMVDGYGPELVTTSTFNSSDISAWSVASGTNSVVDNKLRVTNTINGNYGYAYQAITVEVGKQYELDVIADVHTVSNAHIRVGTTQGGDEYINENILKTTEAKRARERFTATTTTAYIRVGVGVNAIDAFVDIVSVSLRELPSIKWAPHNYCIYSEDPTQSNFNKVNLTISEAAAVLAPDGTMGVHKISFDGAAGDNLYITNGSTTIRGGISGTFGVFAKAVSSDTSIRMRIWDNGSSGAQYADKSVSANDWTLLTHEATTSSNSSTSNFAIYNNSSGDASDIYVWGFHIFRSDLGGMVDNPDRGDSYVPNASREVTGIELITNGSFDSENLSDWTTMSATVAVVNGQVVITDDPSDSTGGRIYQAFTTEVGKTYQVSYNKISGPTGASVYASLNSSYGTNLGGGITATGNQSFTFVATATSTTVVIPTGTTSGLSATFDSISVKEVIGNPNAQRFMPRRNHHVYNGAEWVNEGYYHESDSRTNRIQFSEDLSHSANWSNSGGNLTISAAEKALGLAMWELDDSSTTGYGQLSQALTNSVDATQVWTLSCFVKKDTTATSQFGIRLQQTEGTNTVFTGIIFHAGNGTFLESTWATDVITRTVQDYGDFWRVAVTGQVASGYSGTVVQIFPAHNDLGTTGSSSHTGSHIVGGLQLEINDRASMYKPTKASFLSSSGDVMQIFASNLPWPSPEYAGDNIVSNGTFSSTSNWVISSASADSGIAGGRAYIKSAGNNATLSQTIPTVSGRIYELTFTLVSEDATQGLAYVRQGGDDIYAVNTLDPGTHTTEFVANADNVSLKFMTYGNTNNAFTLDDVIVREIASLPAVTVTMKGRFSYADRDGLEAQPWRWSQGSDELLSMYLYSTGGETGEINVFHEARGNSINTNTSTTHYSPGVLVPFNIAVTGGSKEVAIAAEGINYGASTGTIKHLPNLEYANLQIGYDFSGTISSLRVWDTNLGVQGRMDATAPDLTPSLQLNFDGSNTSYSDDGWVQ